MDVCAAVWSVDPKYVDVIIGRWPQMTGKEAKLDGAGATFRECSFSAVKRLRNPKKGPKDESYRPAVAAARSTVTAAGGNLGNEVPAGTPGSGAAAVRLATESAGASG